MPKFRKKPVVIEAVQFDGTNGAYILSLMDTGSFDHETKELHINTLEGRMLASIGDWVIKGVNGEFYPCKPDIFEKSYKLVD